MHDNHVVRKGSPRAMDAQRWRCHVPTEITPLVGVHGATLDKWRHASEGRGARRRAGRGSSGLLGGARKIGASVDSSAFVNPACTSFPHGTYVRDQVYVQLKSHLGKTHSHRSRGDTTWKAQKAWYMHQDSRMQKVGSSFDGTSSIE